MCKHQRNSIKKAERMACVDQKQVLFPVRPEGLHATAQVTPGDSPGVLRRRPCTLTVGRQSYRTLQRPLSLLPDKKIDCRNLYIAKKEKCAMGSEFAYDF